MLNEQDNELLTRVGPGTAMGDLLRRFWLPILLADQLPGPDCPSVRVRLLGEDLVAFVDTSGRPGLIAAGCAHRLANLYFGRNEEDGLRCVYHGWKFDVKGRCVDMPTEPLDSSFKDKVRVRAYTLRLAGGIYWAFMGDQERIPALPLLPLLQVPDANRFVIKRHQASNFLQAIEGGIDSAHTRYLHTTLEFYKRGPAYLAAIEPLLERFRKDPNSLDSNQLDMIFRTADKAPRIMAMRTGYGLAIGARATVEGMSYWRFNQFMMPFYTLPPRDAGGHAFVPIDDENTWVFTFKANLDKPLMASEVQVLKSGHTAGPFGAPVDDSYYPLANPSNDFQLDRKMQRSYNFTGIMGGGNQDSAMQVSMGPVVDRTQEHLGVTDVGIIEMRRLLLDSVRDLQEGKEPLAASQPEAYAGVRGISLMRPQETPFESCVSDVLERLKKTHQRLVSMQAEEGPGGPYVLVGG